MKNVALILRALSLSKTATVLGAGPSSKVK
jgi:hypothetical protein